MHWFLDLIAHAATAGQSQHVFRIENLEVQELLGLERREGFRYSWDEILRHARETDRGAANRRTRSPPINAASISENCWS